MISTQDLSLHFGRRILFEDVSLKFTPGNCYGLIGANGAGKSTFLKILSGEVEPSSGRVAVPPGLRMSVLKQDHFLYNEVETLTAVLMGHERLFAVMKEKETLYAKPDFGDEDGVRAGELEEEFANLGGWEAEAQVGELLNGLGLKSELHRVPVKSLEDGDKVRVLLAQALFADPDILLLDEPTNHLDVDSILWLEEFLLSFKHTVIVVSHDRHFLNKVCTHMADIDFQKVQLWSGNYDFWRQASEIALQQKHQENRKSEEKAKELKAFIARFSANASKSRQATSRKKMLDKLGVQKIPPSTRKYPHIIFDHDKVGTKQLVSLKKVSYASGTRSLIKDVDLHIQRGQKVVFISEDPLATTALLELVAKKLAPETGAVEWGAAIEPSYFPKDHRSYFEAQNLSLIDWLRQFSQEQSEDFVRSFLGRMLFTGDESRKSVSVLSGGEKVRCMISKLMLSRPACMILDGPTNHLDLESITALNNALIKYTGTVIFASHDVEFIRTLADRVIEITPEGIVDHPSGYDDYLERRMQALGLAV